MQMAHLSLVLVLAVAVPGHAHVSPADTHSKPSEKTPASAAEIDVPDEAQAAVEVVEAFGVALSKADYGQVEAMLDPDVIVLEGGGVESSRSEYLGHHARADAGFLARAEKTLLQRRARIEGNTAWVASKSELHARKDGQPLVLLSTETMVLSNTPSGWRIVHIHWSSRPTPSAEEQGP